MQTIENRLAEAARLLRNSCSVGIRIGYLSYFNEELVEGRREDPIVDHVERQKVGSAPLAVDRMDIYARFL